MREVSPPTSTKTPTAVWVLLLVLLVGSVVLFLPATGPEYEFLHLDDGPYVVKNSVVRQGITREGLAWAFSPQTNVVGNWHPVTMLTHMIDCDLHGVVIASDGAKQATTQSAEAGDSGITGLGPRGHHLTNILLHGLNVALLFWVLYRMTGAVWACALAAALFGLHPLRVESVAWISERKDVLSTLFWLLTMLSYVNYVQRGSRLSYAMALFWLAVGLLSKPMLVTLPCVLLLMDCWPLNRLARPGELEAGFWKRAGFWKTAGRLVLEKVPMFVLVAISCYVTLSVQRSGGAFLGLGSITYADRVANAALSYWIYPWLMIAPHDLAIVHPFSVTQVALWVRIVALASLLVSIVLAAVVYRRAPYVTVGWYWYLGTLVPVIGVVQVGVQAYADRYTYVPGIGIAIIVGWGLRDLVARAPRFRTAAVAASACALAVLAALTFQQLGHWKNTRTICEHTLAVTHENGLAHMTLGAYYMDQGDLGAALPHFEASARYLPSAARSHHYYAAALKKSGDYQPAIQEYRRALELGSEQPWDCYLGMAQSYYTLKDYPQASAMSRQAVEVYQKAKNADLTSARGLLAFSLVKQGRAAEATKVLEEQIALQPKNLTAVILAARIYATHQDAAVRNPTRAVKLADYAARLQEDTTTLDTLAAAQAAQGNFARAGESIQKAVELARRDAESHARTNPELSKRYLGLASELEGRGKLYEKGRPYREDPATYIQ